MPRIVWDKVVSRNFESGLDRGVLYLPDTSAVPWNGLTSVVEKYDGTTSPVYFDGMKIQDFVVLGNFSATMKAVTYPSEFDNLEGMGTLKRGVRVGEQNPQSFGLCYRTQLSDQENAVKGYKIHLLYNVTAVPHEKTYATESTDPTLVEFEWDIVAVPEEVPGMRPTAHYVIDTTDIDPWLLEDIEAKLYGTTGAHAVLLPMADLVSFITEWFRVKIIDNEDGSWTAIEGRPGFIHLDGLGGFYISGVNAHYLDEDTFVIGDTLDIADVPQIRIFDNEDGTWSATTDQDNLIVAVDEGEQLYEIRNANVVYLNDTTYEISDTTDD